MVSIYFFSSGQTLLPQSQNGLKSRYSIVGLYCRAETRDNGEENGRLFHNLYYSPAETGQIMECTRNGERFYQIRSILKIEAGAR